MFAALLLLLVQAESVTTEHFEIVSTHRDRAYVRQVADALESGYAAMTEALGIVPDKEPKYRINLFATLQEYQKQDLELNEGRFAANWAFSHPGTGETYVALQPRGGAPLMDRTRCLFRHEAFHLMAYRHASWLSNVPEWLGEGLAERAAELGAREKGSLPVESDLKFADAVTLTRAMVGWKRAWSLSELIASQGSSHKEHLKRWSWYAQSWLLVKFLSETSSKPWLRFLKRLSDDPKARTRANDLLFEELSTTAEELETRWVAWILKLKPAPWRRVEGDWRRISAGVEGVAFPGRSAYLMSDEILKKPRIKLRADAQVADVGTGQVDLVLSPSEEDHDVARIVKVTLTRTGVAAVLIRTRGEWSRVAWRDIDPALVAPDRWVRLEMEVEGETIRLRADGKLRVEHTFKGDAFPLDDVRWGIGNYDSWTSFRGIEVR